MPIATAELVPHSASPDLGIRCVAATLEIDAPGTIGISFHVEGDIGNLRFPAPGPALRADGLWQHSCFEVFLRPGAGGSYYELNLAASGAWAAYRFDGRRTGRRSPRMPDPRIAFQCGRDRCAMTAVVPLATLPELGHATALAAGLAAVIEDRAGRIAHWALAHPAGPPDFHDPACFTLRLAG